MDGPRFDHLARTLGRGASRRAVLAALVTAGAALAADAAPDAAARRWCNRSSPPGQCCRKGTCTCRNGGRVCGAACCVAGQRCEDGSCAACTVCGSGCAHATIEAALADRDLDVITLAAGAYAPAMHELFAVDITRPVEIRACGDGEVTLDGRNARAVVGVRELRASDTVTLADIAVRHGLARDFQGGGIFHSSGQLVLDSVLVADCAATGDGASDGAGGGILSGGYSADAPTTLVLAGSTLVTANSATNTTVGGGGVAAGAHAMVRCEGAPLVCGNTADPNPNCRNVTDPSCAGVCLNDC